MINKNQQNNFNNYKWLTLDQVADYLQMSKSSIYKIVQKGRIPAYKVGRQWRFKREEVDTWVEKGRLQKARNKR